MWASFSQFFAYCSPTRLDQKSDEVFDSSGFEREESADQFGRSARLPRKSFQARWEPLKKLQDRYSYLSDPSHQLYQLVQESQREADAGNLDRAKDLLAQVEQQVEQEELKLSAAFNLFKPAKADCLGEKEVMNMLKYLGFPHTIEDVDALVGAVDVDGDRQVSLVEFQEYVGRMGGSYKLFEIRRKQLAEKFGDHSGSARDSADLQMDLKEAGIAESEQAYWELVVPPTEFEEAARMVVCQRRAMRHIRTLAKSNHDAAMPKLQRRVLTLGHTEQDLFMTLAYIRELAPILVHVNLTKMMQFLEKDTHYRNQFETATSGGLLKPKVREKWEHDLFGGAYDGTKGFDRPKYGVLNTMNDHRGVIKCAQYGDSYIVLKDVRLRSTFSPEDSANLKADRLAVLDYYGHVLQEYSNDELKETLKVAMSSEAALLGDSSKVGAMKYKETQIHGAICFEKHVDRLVANVRHRGSDTRKLQAICEKHGWKFSWMDQEKKRMEQEEIHKLGAEAWRKRLASVSERPRTEVMVPEGCCRMGCGRKVQPGTTESGKPWSTCCRGCALGFGHNLNCGNVDSTLLGEGMCRNGCGRPSSKGLTPAGRPLTTCCRGCSVSGKHDATCGVQVNATNEPGQCQMGCGRPCAVGKGGRKFVTCCRPCATGQGRHSADCPGNEVAFE
mmetsp:Transcript_49535/g.143724  ORF Transcript_49535/g.143724 Transcript_49535/m.143724 type:complete len:671 (+) Transcript_49535:74-2086(+)